MADGSVQAADGLRVGDRVCGTRLGTRRRYVDTEILARRVTAREAWRVALADGTAIVAGEDQPFLTYRGWKHVTGTERGLARRPHLTLCDRLLGTGRFSVGPEPGAEYRVGYLCGLIRGDGHIGSYRCTPQGKRPWTKHGFRLALADPQPLKRARTYLLDAGVPVTEFQFQLATPTRRPVMAIGNQTQAGVERVRTLVRWPERPVEAWRAGFLAGIFDAEGSCSRRESLRIANTDPRILTHIEEALRHFGFDTTREAQEGRNGLAYIRMRGGFREKLRFFHLTDPAIKRKRNFAGLSLRSDVDLRVLAVEPLGHELPLHELVTGSGDLIVDGVVAGSSGAPSPGPARPALDRASRARPRRIRAPM
jgi:hypothetical protein